MKIGQCVQQLLYEVYTRQSVNHDHDRDHDDIEGIQKEKKKTKQMRRGRGNDRLSSGMQAVDGQSSKSK
jgi:hypothetical protein